MKKTILSVLVTMFCSCTVLMAQTVDYNKIILPDGAQDVSFEERLVQLAWKNNPEGVIVQQEVVQYKEELSSTKTRWTENFGVVGNLNEYNVKEISGTEVNQNMFFPRYNFYGRLTLSMIFNDPHDKKAAAARLRISEARVNDKKLELRAVVLKLYSDVKLAESIWVIRQQTMADEESNYLLIEQKFKNGEAQVDDYIRAQRSRNELKIQLAIAENDYKQVKLELERIIGVRLEDVK